MKSWMARRSAPSRRACDELLGVAAPFAHERRGRHVEEGGAALGGHRLREHRLAGAGRAHHQDALPRTTDACAQRKREMAVEMVGNA